MGGVGLNTTFPTEPNSRPADWITSLRAGFDVIDTDLDDRNGAIRELTSWSIDYERESSDTWRFDSNLVVTGAVESETNCQITPLTTANGDPVEGVIILQCGTQDPISLTTFQCGNGTLDPGEFCDDGNLAEGDGCDARCLNECGNDRLDAGEQCDDGNRSNQDGCTSECQNATCGDGYLFIGVEECDLAGANSQLADAECREDCTPKRCGDGVVDTGEECDDGNDIDTDSCRNQCVAARCGDGVIQTGEECDDGDDNGTFNNASTCLEDCSVFLSSDQIDQINDWGATGFNDSWVTCYSVTRDGLDATAFHNGCNNRGRSVTVALLDTGKKIGGYTALSWTSATAYKYDASSFLFSLTNNHKHTQFGSQYSIYDDANYGPTFGGGHDWTSFYGGNTRYCNLGYTYNCRIGSYNGATCNNDFCGNSNEWNIVEMRVYVAP